MNTATLDSRVSEFDTEEAATSYDRWFCAKVNEAIDDPRPGIAHVVDGCGPKNIGHDGCRCAGFGAARCPVSAAQNPHSDVWRG